MDNDKYIGRLLDGRYEIQEVIGVGGIRTAQDVLEFMLVGAHAVAVGSASFSDPEAIFRIVRELPAVCEEYGVSDLDAFRGSLQG